MDFGNSETLLVNSLAAHKEVLQTHCYSTVKPGYIERLFCEVAGFGVLTAEGDAHRKLRRMLAGMLVPRWPRPLPAALDS